MLIAHCGNCGQATLTSGEALRTILRHGYRIRCGPCTFREFQEECVRTRDRVFYRIILGTAVMLEFFRCHRPHLAGRFQRRSLRVAQAMGRRAMRRPAERDELVARGLEACRKHKSQVLRRET